MASKKYTVIRDTREKLGWNFPKSDRCEGTIDGALKTGDYTLVGFEDVFTVERKRNAGELAGNVCEKRFTKELERLDSFKWAFLVLEFNVADIVGFPVNSGIPQSRWSRLRITPQVIMCRLHQIQLLHPLLNIAFVGKHGREFCSSLFKRVVEYGR